MQKRIAKRYAAERRFKAIGMAAIMLSAGFLAFLLVIMVGNGFRGFTQTELPVEIDFPAVTGGVSPSHVSCTPVTLTMRLCSEHLVVCCSVA